MYESLPEKVADLKILVVGDLMIDHYVWGKFERISPEAPVPLIDVIKEEMMLGGAGNVLKNLISFGVKADVASVIGYDQCADELCQLLKESDINASGVFREEGRITTKKSRVLASHHQMIRIDSETKVAIKQHSEDALINYVQENIGKYDVVLISDYMKGVLTARVLSEIITCARQNNIITIVDPKGSNYAKYTGAGIIKPNKKEASIATGIDIKDHNDLKQAAEMLKEETKADAIIITLSEEGMAIYDNDLEIIPTKARDVFDVTGAGDTVLSGIGICTAAGLSLKEACVFANHAAAIVVAKIGSVVTTVDAVLEHIQSNS